jgi:drug/metabolite transporter (DMT)-like permease
MDTFVFLAVLVAAACHASWNALIKIRLDPFAAMTLIAASSGSIALLVLPFTGFPPMQAWPYLAASMVFHLGYFIGLAEAYRSGDMGQVYPIARGTAPLMTAIFGALVVGEQLSLSAWLGIVLLIVGILLISTHGGRDLARIDRRAVGFALFTAVTICGYSLADGLGGRIGPSPHAYSVTLSALDGAMLLIFAMWRRGPRIVGSFVPFWWVGLFGGGLAFIAYRIAIWAMSVAPIGMVAALRETSVLFASLIAVVILKEPLRRERIAAALMIVSGIALIRLA